MKHATRASADGDVRRPMAQTKQGLLLISFFFLLMLFMSGFALRAVSAEAPDAASSKVVALAAVEPIVEVAEVIEELHDGLSEEMARVRDWVARRYRVSGEALEPALAEAVVSAREAEVDPLLIVAMMAVESSFNPLAESHAGALGLMQVIPRWHMDKIGEENGPQALFDPRFNVQVGTLVLMEGMQRFGSLEAALQYYNGARNDPERRYTKRVMAMKQQLMAAAERAGGA